MSLLSKTFAGILSVFSIFATTQSVDAQDLKITDSVVGTGAEAVSGKSVTVHYDGYLSDNGKKGKKFDSSHDRGDPFEFNLGAGQVIQGWDQGVKGMKVGGKRTLIIPAALGYGSRGAGGAIPPNAELIFDVELLKVH
jgi:FKBP-type peptidyl-prolyl cis-trans isomerase